jgi:outer membrane protein TolC
MRHIPSTPFRLSLLPVAAGLLLLAALPARAQQPSTPPAAATGVRQFTVQQAVDYALANYPAVRAALEQYNASRAGIGLARTSYLPRLNGAWQIDRGSRESVLGVLLPQDPTILTGSQGSVTPHANRPFWTSGAGVLLSWEPFEFGYRHAQVLSAVASANTAQAQVTLTRLGVASAVAEASLGLLAQQQRVAASQADVSRRQVFNRSVHALVDAHLRPGADASRADAELAAARTRLIQAEQDSDVARIALAQILGLAGTSVQIVSGPFLTIPPSQAGVAGPLQANPVAQVQMARVSEEKARIRVLNRSYIPHFTASALLSGRGSAETSTGAVQGDGAGLTLTADNWEAGITAQMDLTSIFSIRERKKVEVSRQRSQEALYAQTMQILTAQQQTALAQLNGARRVAQNTPTELAAARESEMQAVARFRAGLGTIVDVAEAESLLTQAETDDSLARLSIWRALVGLASANGNLTPFLNTANAMSQGGH